MVFSKFFKSKLGFITTTSLTLLSCALSSSGVYAMEESVEHFSIRQLPFPLSFEIANEHSAYGKALMNAKKGDLDALVSLGSMLYYGKDIHEDDRTAFKCFLLAADQGLAEAQWRVSTMLTYEEGVEKNDVQAFKYAKLAADQNHGMGLFCLGHMFYYGQGVEKDEEQAINFYKLAADEGIPTAQNMLNTIYANKKQLD